MPPTPKQKPVEEEIENTNNDKSYKLLQIKICQKNLAAERIFV